MPHLSRSDPKNSERGARRHRRRTAAAVIAGVLFETIGLWLRSGRIAGNVVVRCRKGHLFTTLWIPGASIKSLRFGWWRLQRCPTGHHWSIVTPVKEATLSDEERRTARERHDIRLP